MKSEQNIKAALDEYSDMIRRICYLHLKNHFDVEDVFQEVFLKYALHTKDFESHEHEKAWFIRVSINSCKDILKSAFRKKVTYLDDLAYEPSYIQEEHRDTLNAVLRLPQKYRIVIYMFYYEGYSAVEISQLLKKKENTIYSWLSRARTLLKTDLGGDVIGSQNT